MTLHILAYTIVILLILLWMLSQEVRTRRLERMPRRKQTILPFSTHIKGTTTRRPLCRIFHNEYHTACTVDVTGTYRSSSPVDIHVEGECGTTYSILTQTPNGETTDISGSIELDMYSVHDGCVWFLVVSSPPTDTHGAYATFTDVLVTVSTYLDV